MDKPTEPESAHFWTYHVSEKTYTPTEIDSVPYNTFKPSGRRDPAILPGDTREIPIQTISPGMLLFHYCTFPQRNQGETDNDYERRLFGILLSQHGVPAIYLPSTDRWQFCFGSRVASQQYYYTVPVAGMGIKDLGSNFNSCIISSTNRTTKWAYLKSGTTVDEKRAVHRRYPLPEYPNYDFKRLKMCDRIHDGGWPAPGQCRPGREYDICITPEFQASEHIDGITCIAGEDSLIDITKNWEGEYVFDEDKSMLKNMLRWRRQIITHRNSPVDHFAWAMNLLCLESDLKNDRINVGFREFSNGPMGHHHANPDYIPPSPLPAEFGVVDTDYWITSQDLDAQGVCIKRVIQIKNDPALIALFMATYITPYLVVSPFIFATPYGAIDYHALDDKYNLPDPPADIVEGCKSSREQRYMMSHHIAKALYDLGNETNPPYSLRFDYRLNVFFKQGPPHASGCFDRTIPIQVQQRATPVMVDVLKIIDPENPLIPEPHTNNKYMIGHYTTPFKNATLKECQERKILHEIISNTKWDTHWMHEFFSNESVNAYFIQVGPYRNPLSLPFGNKESHGDIVDVYRFIIDGLEPPLAGAIPSHTYQYINDEKVRTYIQAWATNPGDRFTRPANISRPGLHQPYHTGIWFHDIIGDRRFLGGGNKKNNRKKGGRLFTTRNNRNNRNRTSFLSKSNQTHRNIQTKSPMVYNKNKRNNIPPTSSYPMNNNKKQTSTRTGNKVNESNRTEKEFVQMNKDTFDSLIRVFKNKKYRIILDALQKRTSSSDD